MLRHRPSPPTRGSAASLAIPTQSLPPSHHIDLPRRYLSNRPSSSTRLASSLLLADSLATRIATSRSRYSVTIVLAFYERYRASSCFSSAPEIDNLCELLSFYLVPPLSVQRTAVSNIDCFRGRLTPCILYSLAASFIFEVTWPPIPRTSFNQPRSINWVLSREGRCQWWCIGSRRSSIPPFSLGTLTDRFRLGYRHFDCPLPNSLRSIALVAPREVPRRFR